MTFNYSYFKFCVLIAKANFRLFLCGVFLLKCLILIFKKKTYLFKTGSKQNSVFPCIENVSLFFSRIS